MEKVAPLRIRFCEFTLEEVKNGRNRDLFTRLDDTCANLFVIGKTAIESDLFFSALALHMQPKSTRAVYAQTFTQLGIAAKAYYLPCPDDHISLASTHFSAEPGVNRFYPIAIPARGIPH